MGNIMREEITSLDLNQEPLNQHQNNSVIGRIEESVITHGGVDERLRELEEVDSRTRRWRSQVVAPPPRVHVTDLGRASAEARNEGRLLSEDNESIEAQERVIRSGKSNKMNGTHLIAKALGIESDTDVDGRLGKGGFFDCNVCLEMAMEPILTCCGHLFCWPCFYNLPYDCSDVKECPVCGGEVTDASLVPIYGNGNGNCSRKLKKSGLEAPPRPRAQRVESVRQNRVNRWRIVEGILRLTDMIGRIGERSSSLASHFRTSHSSPSNESSTSEYHEAGRIFRPVPRAALLTPLSSALNSAAGHEERMANDLEAYSNAPHNPGRSSNNQQSLREATADAASVFAATALADSESSDVAAGSSSASLPLGLSLGLDISPVPARAENQTVNGETEETEFSSTFWTTPGGFLRFPDQINGIQRETRRRRLR